MRYKFSLCDLKDILTFELCDVNLFGNNTHEQVYFETEYSEDCPTRSEISVDVSFFKGFFIDAACRASFND